MTILLMIILAFLVVLWRTQPAKADVTITAIRYTLDDVLWIGLNGATLEPGYINVAVTWKNNSSESVDTLMTLVVEDQGQEPDEERVTLAPNEDATAAILMEFMEGERKVTATIYNEGTMSLLDTKTVNVSVVSVSPPPPVCTIGETKCEGYDLYSCQLIEGAPAWELLTPNSSLCGYVPPVCTEGEEKCVGFDLYKCLNNQWELLTSNSTLCGYEPPVCTEGEEKCVGFDLYKCLNNKWELLTPNSSLCGYVPPPVCTIGETKCVGYDLYSCQLIGGVPAWEILTPNSELCGYVPPPPPECTTGETKCVGYDLYTCQNGKWEILTPNSSLCGYVPPPPPPDYITRELALMMIDEYSVPLGPIGFMGKTDTGGMPDWNPYYDPQDAYHQWPAICGYEVGVRYCIMDGSKEPCPKYLYYYRNIYDRWEQMWKPDPLGLPFYAAFLTWPGGPGHWLCVLKVGADVNSFSSWIFFNYYERDILPGVTDQMPYGAHIAVQGVNGVSETPGNEGHIRATGVAIAEFDV